MKQGLDLKMVTFACVPTGHKRGMIEMVSNAETLRKIQVEFGLTGSFKDRPIAEWLAKHNPSELEYEKLLKISPPLVLDTAWLRIFLESVIDIMIILC